MAPPTGPLNLDVEAISGICGSISIACWVVVFSPQIVENFRRGSADGLSLQFIIVWLLGDVFNILGAVMQGVLPTMIILAIYYSIADVVLLGQCFYYRGFTWRDEVVPSSAPTPKPSDGGVLNGNGSGHNSQQPNERTALLANGTSLDQQPYGDASSRRGSWSDQSYHLSPAVPLIDDAVLARDALAAAVASPSSARGTPDNRPSRLQAVAFNFFAVLMVCASGVAGWYLSRSRSSREAPSVDQDLLEFNVLGQVFGWLCAVLYLGSRVPQILLNYRRKSTEGVSMLFFLFACLGNLTYVLSIFAFEPHCRDPHADMGSHAGSCAEGEAGRIYGQYILVNLSWLAGSLGTLLLDMGIFVQFFIYNNDDGEEFYADCDAEGSRRAYSPSAVAIEEDDDEESIDGDRWDPRPILQRSISNSPR